MVFEVPKDGKAEQNACIQKKGDDWTGEFCETIVTESDSGE